MRLTILVLCCISAVQKGSPLGSPQTKEQAFANWVLRGF